MPGPLPGTFTRNARCLDETGLSYSELCMLVAIVAARRVGLEPPTKRQLTALLLQEEGFACDHQTRDLERRGLVTRRKGWHNELGFLPTARGSGKFSALRAGAWAEREEGAAAE
jgi:hypothetical protein